MCNRSAVYSKAFLDQSKPLQYRLHHYGLYSPIRKLNSPSCFSVIHKFDYVFAENGTVQYKDGRLVSKHVSEHVTPGSVCRFLRPTRGMMVMDCCDPIRPSRTRSGRSCCRTWSTSASATWGWLNYQRKGETLPDGLQLSTANAQLWAALAKPLNVQRCLVCFFKTLSCCQDLYHKHRLLINPGFYWIYLQGDLHWVQERHAQHFSHWSELHKGGTDGVLWNRQGESLSCLFI